MASEFIGAGLAFPLRIDATGGIALVAGERELEEAMRLIIGTAKGERPMRPHFGCGIHDLVFDRADAATAARIEREVEAALARWEPRVQVRSVAVTTAEDDPAVLYIDVTYEPVGTNDPRNLVFPFYVIPLEEPT